MIFFFFLHIISLSLFLFVCLKRWDGFHSRVPKIKFFQIVHVKGCGLCSDFLKSQNQNSSHDPETLKPSGQLDQCLLREEPGDRIFNCLQSFAVPPGQGLVMKQEG